MGRSSPSPSDWRQWRRIRALGLHRQGWTQCDIAAALGISKGAVSQGLAAARKAGPEALVSQTDRRGVAPGLTPEQVRLIPDSLWRGAEAPGFPGDAWTCGRVAGVLRRSSPSRTAGARCRGR